VIRRSVVVSKPAAHDLIELYDHIADAASPLIASRYLDRLEGWLLRLDLASERGSRRDDVRPGLRTLGFERKITIAFVVTQDHVTILRVFRGGRDWRSAFEDS